MGHYGTPANGPLWDMSHCAPVSSNFEALLCFVADTMVRNRKPCTKACFDDSVFETAISELIDGTSALRAAADSSGIPKSTLARASPRNVPHKRQWAIRK